MNVLLNKYSKEWIRIVCDISWAQWNRLGVMGSGPVNQYSTDIEAALLLAAVAVRWDLRLYAGVCAWLNDYSEVINAERLAMLVRRSKDDKDEWIARFLGGILEREGNPALRAVVQQCRKLCSSDWRPQPLRADAQVASWRANEPHMKEWGILVEDVKTGGKVHDHHYVLRLNLNMRCRRLFGNTTRADVLYLLSVSHHCRHKREVDHLTAVRLSARLGCHYTTVYRIQKDLEEGGFLVPQRQLRNQYVVTWRVQDETPLLKSDFGDRGLVDWLAINEAVFKVLELQDVLQTLTDERRVNFAVNTYYEESILPILLDQGIEAPPSYGQSGKPLNERSPKEMLQMVSAALRSARDHIAGEEGER